MGLVLREQKGKPLTHKELDDNLSYLDLVTQGGTIKGDLNISGHGQSLSIGATVNYVHGPDVADTEWDPISDSVHLTRGFTSSVYNILSNPIKWNRDGWSDLTDLSDRIFYDNLTEIQSNIDNWLVGSELILLDVTDNKYYKIEFTYWQAGGEEGNGGAFTYNRNLVTPRIYQKLQTEEISAIKITADKLTVTDLSVDNVQPEGGTLSVPDATISTKTVEAANANIGTVVVDTEITAPGYKVESKTDDDFVMANGGTLPISTLKAGIYQLCNPYYNITNSVPLTTGYYTSTTARAAVPEGIRKTGLILTYETAAGVWYTERYIGTATDTTSWTTAGNWEIGVLRMTSVTDTTEYAEITI